MIVSTVYTCEVCGTQYYDEQKCAACEEKHKTDLNIVSARHEPNRGFPVKIKVIDEKTKSTKTYVEA